MIFYGYRQNLYEGLNLEKRKDMKSTIRQQGSIVLLITASTIR